jgi:hypothetical protein
MNVFKAASTFFGLSTDVTDSAHELMESKFLAHVAEYGLNFGTQEEYAFRLSQFAMNDQIIEETNAE